MVYLPALRRPTAMSLAACEWAKIASPKTDAASQPRWKIGRVASRLQRIVSWRSHGKIHPRLRQFQDLNHPISFTHLRRDT
jgi:hypothetical protein